MSQIDVLLKQPNIWRARDFATQPAVLEATAIPTGYDILDQLFYGGGWPQRGLVECLCDRYGIGELRLLMPGMCQAVQEEAPWIVWINPPLVPYAPALQQMGINTERLLLVYPKDHKEALWTLEESLTAGSCKVVVAWLREEDLRPKQLQRIQTQARQAGVWITLFRPNLVAHKPSPAELRLQLAPVPGNTGAAIQVAVLKRRGGWPIDAVEVSLCETPVPVSAQELQHQMERWLQCWQAA